MKKYLVILSLFLLVFPIKVFGYSVSSGSAYSPVVGESILTYSINGNNAICLDGYLTNPSNNTLSADYMVQDQKVGIHYV